MVVNFISVQLAADATIEARAGISHRGYVVIRSPGSQVDLSALDTKVLRALAGALAEVADKQDAIAQHLAHAQAVTQ